MTRLLTEKQIDDGVKIIRGGGLVAFRTETVYGLGGSALNNESVRKIYTAKSRPASKQLVWQFPSVKAVVKYFPQYTDKMSQKILKKFKSGLTLILPNGIGVRIPNDSFARKFLQKCECPLVVTSANTSAKPAPKTWNEVYDDLGGRIDAVFMSGPCKLGVASTIAKINGGKIEIVREGTIPARKLEKFNI